MPRVAPEKAAFRPALAKRSLPGLYGADMRKALSKKLRFDVFKRDGFKCQYCGGEAPKVILQVDHIDPVAKGGKNDILNLITACFECNSGKSDRTLSDDSAVAKQRAQLDELHERREQLEMMLRWRDGMQVIVQDQKKAIADQFRRASGFSIRAESKLPAEWLRKYALNKILDAIDLACEKYLERGPDGKVTQVSAEVALDKVGKILNFNEKDPAVQRLHYIRGIVRNRMHLGYSLMDDMKRALSMGVSVDDIEYEAKSARNWTAFNGWLQGAITEASAGQ
jgi:hypothetical protein